MCKFKLGLSNTQQKTKGRGGGGHLRGCYDRLRSTNMFFFFALAFLILYTWAHICCYATALFCLSVVSMNIALKSRKAELSCRVYPFLSYQNDYLEWDGNNNIR